MPNSSALLPVAITLSFAFGVSLPGAAAAQDALPAPVAAAIADGPAPADARGFLAWSLAKHKALTSYQARSTWTLRMLGKGLPSGAGDLPSATRTIEYATPNRFRVRVESGPVGSITAVSDGKKLLEVVAGPGQTIGLSGNAPERFGSPSASMSLGNPMFAGSPLYGFFSGAADVSALADTAKQGAPLRFGPDILVDGEPCKTLKFYAAKSLWGNVQAMVSTRDGLVRRLSYDCAPLVKAMRERQAGTPAQQVTGFQITETVAGIRTAEPVPDAAFDTTPPPGVQVTDTAKMAGGGKPDPPVPLGKPAPAFTVAPIGSGRPVTLASLKGRVVLVDFWATWCGPCVRGLPETLKLHTDLAGRGLTVLAVTDEDAATVRPFLKKNRFPSLPAYRDAGGAASKAYGVQAIPTVAVIDRQGRLSAFFVGLQSPETLRDALKKAGL